MQPYQQATQEVLRRGGNPLSEAAKIGSVALGASSGKAVINRILPFLNKYIPSGMAIKGLSKIDKRFGDFFNSVTENGYGEDEALGFLKDKMEPSQQASQPEGKNIIKQYSDELDAFIQGQMQQGENALQAGARAQLNPKFKSIIDKMKKDHKTDWASILENTYGGQTQPQAAQSMQQEQSQAQQPQGASLPPDIVAAMQDAGNRMRKLRGG